MEEPRTNQGEPPIHLSVGLELDAGAHLEVFEHGTVTSKHAREAHRLIGFVPADGSGDVTGSPAELFTGAFNPVGMFPRVANGAGPRTIPLRVVARHRLTGRLA